MTGITRTAFPVKLAETDRAFREAIHGMSRKEAYQYYQKHQRRFLYNTAETKQAFEEMNAESCSFCTRFISDFEDAMTVEHIRIKRDFPEEIFQWNNLLCACEICNKKRSTKPYDAGMYLDPTVVKDVENYFRYDLDGSIRANEELDEDSQKKANYMIELYQLNRKRLVCQRRVFLKNLIEDEHFYDYLMTQGISSQNIIFWSVFTYYKRSKGRDGE